MYTADSVTLSSNYTTDIKESEDPTHGSSLHSSLSVVPVGNGGHREGRLEDKDWVPVIPVAF